MQPVKSAVAPSPPRDLVARDASALVPHPRHEPVAVSIVIPVYNEAENLHELVARIDAAMTPTGRSFELLLVDDGSRDKSGEALAALASSHHWLRPLELIRNYGQSTALQHRF